MEVRYCPDVDFKMTVHAMKAELTNLEGHMRWVVTTEEGEQFILRPDSAKPDAPTT